MEQTKSIYLIFSDTDDDVILGASETALSPFEARNITGDPEAYVQRHWLRGSESQFSALLAHGTIRQVWRDGYEAHSQVASMLRIMDGAGHLSKPAY